jgi:D-glycero-alpha-D-manno-heptose-7-phosphate kinase
MIVARAPLRFSLGGGGTDLPAYADRFEGFVVAAAVDRHVHVCVARRLLPGLSFSHERTEHVASPGALEHPIARAALEHLGIDGGLQIASISELPAGSGLGSSGSFTVTLLAGLHASMGRFPSPRDLAEEAAHLEIEVLGAPCGRQDPFIAAHGGVAAMRFGPGGRVDVEPLEVAPSTLRALEARLLVVHTGIVRRSADVLGEQTRRLEALDDATLARMHRIRDVGLEVRQLLERAALDRFGELLHDHWVQKRRLTERTSDDTLDAHYDAARAAGAIGGKLMGAGGGGFFLFYVRPEDRAAVEAALGARGLTPLPFGFASEGVRVHGHLRDEQG